MANISSKTVQRNVTPHVADTVAWRERVLVFQGTAIAEVAAQYNRYNTAQIRIEDPDIAQHR